TADESNPIIDASDHGGAEDSFIAQTITGEVWRDSDGKALLFAEEKDGADHRGVNLWKSDTDTLDNWTFFGRVLDKGGTGTWNQQDSTSPTVFYDQGSNKLVMLFEGRDSNSTGAVGGVGLAFSDDEGETFTAMPDPVIPHSNVNGTWNKSTVIPDAIFYKEGKYIILTHGYNED